eukprot:m.233819 g.233819  ORF g.233819 m.233819 type:complete len:211 (-) comp54299_c0_seq25:3757-4389(-)
MHLRSRTYPSFPSTLEKQVRTLMRVLVSYMQSLKNALECETRQIEADRKRQKALLRRRIRMKYTELQRDITQSKHDHDHGIVPEPVSEDEREIIYPYASGEEGLGETEASTSTQQSTSASRKTGANHTANRPKPPPAPEPEDVFTSRGRRVLSTQQQQTQQQQHQQHQPQNQPATEATVKRKRTTAHGPYVVYMLTDREIFDDLKLLRVQ